MEADLRNLGHPHRLKRPQPHVESQRSDMHTAGAYPLKNPGREVQPRGGCSDRTALASKHSLVTLAVERLICTTNIRWQRDMAQLLQPGEEVIDWREAK